MGWIKGMPVILVQKTENGTDAFNHPVFIESEITVEDVLVAPASSDDITTSTDLVGKRAEYTLGIPKGDTHNWENTIVKFFGHTFRTFGFTIEGIEANVPTKWHKKVMVERYE